MNLYQAFGGNPVNFVDPWGEQSKISLAPSESKYVTDLINLYKNYGLELQKRFRKGSKLHKMGQKIENIGNTLGKWRQGGYIIWGISTEAGTYGGTGPLWAIALKWHLAAIPYTWQFSTFIVLDRPNLFTPLGSHKNAKVRRAYAKLLATLFHEGRHALGRKEDFFHSGPSIDEYNATTITIQFLKQLSKDIASGKSKVLKRFNKRKRISHGNIQLEIGNEIRYRFEEYGYNKIKKKLGNLRWEFYKAKRPKLKGRTLHQILINPNVLEKGKYKSWIKKYKDLIKDLEKKMEYESQVQQKRSFE